MEEQQLKEYRKERPQDPLNPKKEKEKERRGKRRIRREGKKRQQLEHNASFPERVLRSLKNLEQSLNIKEQKSFVLLKGLFLRGLLTLT